MPKKTSNKPCTNSEQHTSHLCELESQQEWDTLSQVTDKPLVRCENCWGEANAARYVCVPVDL